MKGRQRLEHIAEKAGCAGYEIVRKRKHLTVDFITENGTRVRATIAQTASDHRALDNQIAVVKRQLREKGF